MSETTTKHKSSHRFLAALRSQAERAFCAVKARVVQHFQDGALLLIGRRRSRSGSYELLRRVRMGPNCVHAFITHGEDGGITDLGVSYNMLTIIGNMLLQGSIGGYIPAGGAGSPATAVSTSAVTATGTPWTASNLATPQLGIAGFRIYAPVTSVGTAPVYANVISNTTSVATIDQWWTAVDGVGTTPASTNAFIIGAGGVGSVRFMGLTTDATAAAGSDQVLPTEITTNGAARALATFTRGSAPTGSTSTSGTFTLQKAFSILGTFTAIAKMGLFASMPQGGTTAALGGPLVFETLLNATATVVSGDTLTCFSGDTKIKTRNGPRSLREMVGKNVEVLNRFGQWEQASVHSFGTQRLHQINFAHLNPVYATADHRWWQRDGSRVKTTELRRVPFTEDETAHAQVTAITDTGRDEEVFCCVTPGSESFTLANGLTTSNCTDTLTLSG